MLVLSRKANEAVRIGEEVIVRVLAIRGGRVTLGIEAPPEVEIDREEVRQRKIATREQAASAVKDALECCDCGSVAPCRVTTNSNGVVL